MKKVLSLILVLCMVAVVLPMRVSAADANGTVGSCVWKLEGTKLTISGNGSTGTFSLDNPPWGRNITEVVVGEGVTNLCIGMFEGCRSLRSVKLPSTLKTIGLSAFNGCSSLTSIDIPEGVATIEGGTFVDCSSLVQVNIPKTVTSMGLEMFSGCYALASITVHEDNPSFKSVDGILFNKNMTKLIAYPQNKQGQKYTVPDTVTDIGYKAFEEARNLIYVYLPDNITHIGHNAFFLTIMQHMPENQYNGGFYLGDYFILQMDKKMTSTSIREGTKVIADGAFSGSTEMVAVNIPDGVTHIGDSALAWLWKLQRVSIPKSVKYISESAFYDCTALKTVFYRGSMNDRSRMFVGGLNDSLTGAKWTYNACINSEQHVWGETTVTKQADCTTDGEEQKTCTLCKSVNTTAIPAKGHSFGITSQTKVPTCVEAGVTEKICTVCQHVEQGVLPPTEHVFGPWNVEIQPTCDDVGVEKRICSLCDGVEARNIEAIGHDYGEFAIVTEATAEQEGSEQAVCKNCGDVQTRTIPKPETTPAPETTPEPETTPAEEPQSTGIAFGGMGMLVAFVAVVVIAGAVITALLIDKFKKRS